MYYLDYIRVSGCPLCSIFDNEEIITKLYYPETIDGLDKIEFVIVDCKSCNIPMVVYCEHVTSITSEAWGRILYQARKLFGKTIVLKEHKHTIKDHIHWHVHNMNKY